MDPRNPVDIDALIEDVLNTERLEHVPTNFHKKIGECVRVAALRQRENNRFRVTILMVSLGMIAIVFTGMGVLALTHGGAIRENGFPGIYGIIDQYRTIFHLYWAAIDTQQLLIVASALTAITLVLGFLPLSHSLKRS